MELDLLALLSDAEPGGPAALQAPADADRQVVAVANAVDADAIVPYAPRPSPAPTPKLPSQVGQVGKGRHGTVFEKRLLTSHMRFVKLARKTFSFGEDVRALLDDSKFLTSAGDIIGVRARSCSTVGGLVLQLSKQSKVGNRYQRSISWAEFLEAAYGRFKRNAALSIYLNKGISTIKNMQVFVSGAWMNQQALLLAKLLAFTGIKPPLVVFKHMKFDETALLCSLNPDKGKRRTRSTWQTMVYRLRVVIVWETGENLVLPIVVPPVVMLSTGAAHQFYALNFHPSFRCVNGLVKMLQDQAQESFDLLEADGAKSNERLLAHLYQLCKDQRKLMSHARCMSHASQLVNVAVLTALDPDVMNRLYALTVFLRNLGYWGRLQQALRQWISQALVFRQEAVSKTDLPECAPHVHEFLNFMRFWKDLESEASEHMSREYRQKLARVAELCNAADGGLCHICTSPNVPLEHRHCQDRDDCVRKLADALTDLFLSCMPTIPVPSKWTTMFMSLDFCLGGFLFGNWLPHVFKVAFGTLQFAEFEEGAQMLDPRVIEALSFSAVNGRRFRSSLGFLESATSPWLISLLSLVLEASRSLTFYWLGSLKKSLSPRERCVLFEVLDPSVSIVEGVLKHLSELVMNVNGAGRLQLLWHSYPTYQDFCMCEPGKVRQLRRALLLMAGWIFRRQHVYMSSLQYSIATLGDPDADPSVQAAVIKEWDSKSVCCIPPGVARMLKQRGLTGADLCLPRWRSLLFWYGSTLTWTIADVEQTHAVNRLSSGCSFSTICAKYINATALRQTEMVAAKADADGERLRTSSALDFCADGSRISVLQKPRRKGTKKQSALELFRNDFLRRQSLSGSVNPCSKDFWKDVKREFEQLSQQQRDVYESLAADSSSDAAAARAAARVPRSVPQAVPAAAPTALAKPCSTACCPRHVPQLSFQDFMHAKDLPSVMRLFEAQSASGTKASKVATWFGFISESHWFRWLRRAYWLGPPCAGVSVLLRGQFHF